MAASSLTADACPPSVWRGCPLVAALCPTYGRFSRLRESLACFLAQDYPNKQLIILNDADVQIGDPAFDELANLSGPAAWIVAGVGVSVASLSQDRTKPSASLRNSVKSAWTVPAWNPSSRM